MAAGTKEGKVLVAVPAHADDAELNAGGLLAKWAGEGGTVHIVMATNNCSGLMVPPGSRDRRQVRLGPAETQAVRHREQEAAAALIGAAVHYLDYPQRHYWDPEAEAVVRIGFAAERPAPPVVTGRPPLVVASHLPEPVARLGALLAELKPDLVVTQTPVDTDPEHHATASLVWTAMNQDREAFAGAVLRFWCPGASCYNGVFDPGHDVIEDTSDYFEKKVELCAAHASQFNDFRREMVEKRDRAWGERLGVKYAEPYRTARFSTRADWFTSESG